MDALKQFMYMDKALKSTFIETNRLIYDKQSRWQPEQSPSIYHC